ncbi:MAG TPA: OmpA family protein [Nannocystaceae bacterium]|nr:OmpA family protein [Nannocystaceae bacterium]
MKRSAILVALISCSLPNLALAAPAATGSVEVSPAGTSTSGKVETRDKRKDVKWIKRWAPERNMAEIGIYGGLFVPARKLELFQPDNGLPDMGYKPLRKINGELGARIGYYPIRFLGLELEGGAMLARTTNDDRATLYHVRGHLVGQLGLWSVTPFVLAGISGLGVSSSRRAVGSDIDMGFHFGGGLKIYASRWIAFRVDLRDTLTAGRGVDEGVINNFEALLGLSITLGRKDKEKPKPIVEAPEPGPGDKDGDGFLDPDDRCIDEPGVAPDGCPIRDKDGDGFLDPDDRCIDEPGVAPDGCPIRDKDGDGILDPDDSCIDEPETKNNYKDKDGCPDEVPQEVAKFTGAIEGIFFDTDKATIKPKSRPVLDKAVKVLKDFPDVKVEIVGHTDSTGDRTHNIDLSQRRADAVKKYLVDHGIAADRMETRGAGPDEPLGENTTKAGKAKNRRIEFKLLTR